RGDRGERQVCRRDRYWRVGRREWGRGMTFKMDSRALNYGSTHLLHFISCEQVRKQGQRLFQLQLVWPLLARI
ncbi:hypothetical protein MF4836_33435, partial [Pseudomonas sp. MF4836]